MNTLSDRWRALFPEHPHAARWWTELERRHTEPQRHYHTLEHLEAMFRHWDAHRDALRDPEAVALAIFFHDIVYQPGRADNEAESAKLALTER